MSRYSKFLIGAISVALLCSAIANAQLPTSSDEYVFAGSGYGLAAERIAKPYEIGGDNLRDLIVTNLTSEGGCFVNLNTLQPPYFDFAFNPVTIAPARQAVFALLRLGQPYKDLAVAKSYVKVYRNYNNGTLPLNQTLYNGINDWIAIGRVTSLDFHNDLVGCDYNNLPYVRRFFNDGSGNLVAQTPPFDTGDDADKVQLADLDYYQLNTLPELFVVSYPYNLIKIFNNDGQGSFSTLRQPINTGGTIQDYIIGDINNDDYNDLVVSDIYTVKTYLNNCSGQLVWNETLTLTYMGFDLMTDQVGLLDYDYDGYPDLVVNDPGWGSSFIFPDQNNGDFGTTPIWVGLNSNSASMFLYCSEIIAVDLRGFGSLSLVGTGYDSEGECRFWVFKDYRDPRICPIKNFNVGDGEGHHPELHWQASPADDAGKYRIFRALTETDDPPPLDAFVLIDSVDHPNDTYTDYDVYMIEQHPNCKIWYFVKAVDLADQESVPSNVVRFWGIYHPESNQPAEEVVAVAYLPVLQLNAAPNPFNPSTTINFALPEASQVTLTVYDVQGLQVAQLVNGWREAGTHEVTFDGSNLASGVYVYRLAAGEFNASGKMVLLK